MGDGQLAGLIVGITGTRMGGQREQQVRLRRVLRELAPMREFLHGDCIGVDSYAHSIVLDYQWAPVVEIYPSTLEGQRAYCSDRRSNSVIVNINRPRDPLVRNQMIVNRCSLLIAVPETETEMIRSGTWATVRYARRQRRPIWLIMPNGTLKKENV